MARLKRKSTVLESCGQRLSGLEAIDEELDLGNGLSIEAFKLQLQNLDDMMESYNTQLAEMDAAATALKQKERAVKAFSSRMLKGVAARYGTNSPEYEKAGGVPDSKRKRPVRRNRPGNPEAA